jgi:hypothetical protein
MKAQANPIASSPTKMKIYANIFTSANLATFLSINWNAYLAAEQKQQLLMAT